MGVDGFNKANSKLELKKSDVLSVVSIYKDKDVLFDIFSVLASIGIFLWVTLFVFSLMGKGSSKSYVSIVGYISIILVVIYSAKHIYINIEEDFAEKCNGDPRDTSLIHDDYVIESTNRFYSILSFVYFYVKTYVVTLLNISVFCLGMFIFHHALTVNIEKDFAESWVANVVENMKNNDDPILKFLAYVYLIFGLILYLYIYASIFIYLSANYLFDGTKYLSGMKNVNLAAGILMFVFLIPVLYYNDFMTDLWRRLIKKTAIGLTGSTRYPVLEIFAQANVFKYIDLREEKTHSRHVRIFLYGLLMTIVFSFIVLPSFSAEHLCSMNALKIQNGLKGDEHEVHDNLLNTSKEFQARFQFGYFVMVIVVVLFHVCEASLKSVLVSSEALHKSSDANHLNMQTMVSEYKKAMDERKVDLNKLAAEYSLIRALDGLFEIKGETGLKHGKENVKIILDSMKQKDEEIKKEMFKTRDKSQEVRELPLNTEITQDKTQFPDKPDHQEIQDSDALINNIALNVKHGIFTDSNVTYEDIIHYAQTVSATSEIDESDLLLITYVVNRVHPRVVKTVLTYRKSYMGDVKQFKNRKDIDSSTKEELGVIADDILKLIDGILGKHVLDRLLKGLYRFKAGLKKVQDSKQYIVVRTRDALSQMLPLFEELRGNPAATNSSPHGDLSTEKEDENKSESTMKVRQQ